MFYSVLKKISHRIPSVSIGGGKENVIPNFVGPLSSYLTSSSLRSPSVRCDSELLGVRSSPQLPSVSIGGGKENRTPDPLLAKQVLSQLSYTPITYQNLLF